MRERIVITGAGAICALGNNAAECWHALAEGRSAIAPIESVDTAGMRFRNGAEVRGFSAEAHFTPPQCDLLDRFAQFGVVAAREALAQSGLVISQGNAARVGVVTGTALGGQVSQDRAYQGLYRDGQPRPHPFTIPRGMSNAAASHISTMCGVTGPVFTVSTACASATHAIGQALWMLRSGAADAVVAGGSEAPFSPACLRAWEAMRVISPDTCRPFTRDRSGMILGEGAAMLVLEPESAALARGAEILAEVAGFGMSADAGHITQPSVDGPARAMQAALADAQLAATEVGYVNAHGTATLANDPAEAAAIREVFGEHAPAVSSTKSLHGHALGAAGAIEASATVMALCHGVLPPTANFTERDPACDIDVIANTAREQQVDAALSNSFAFGGLNAVLAFRRWTGRQR